MYDTAIVEIIIIEKIMKNASVKEILSNKKLWNEDLSFLEEEVLKYVDKQA